MSKTAAVKKATPRIASPTDVIVLPARPTLLPNSETGLTQQYQIWVYHRLGLIKKTVIFNQAELNDYIEKIVLVHGVTNETPDKVTIYPAHGIEKIEVTRL